MDRPVPPTPWVRQSFWSDLADEEPLSEEQAEKRTGRSGGCCPWRLVQFGKVIPSDGSD